MMYMKLYVKSATIHGSAMAEMTAQFSLFSRLEKGPK
jgi:hypothetical protein